MDDIFTVFQASQYCKVSPQTIINWIDQGHIKAYKTPGGHRRINIKDLEFFMQKQGIPIPQEKIDTLEKTGHVLLQPEECLKCGIVHKVF